MPKSNDFGHIENCVGYITYILQFSICLTAIECNLNHPFIHIKNLNKCRRNFQYV